MSSAAKVVKSAKRVLEVLEFFGPERREAAVVDIVRALGYPQSSTSALLRSLHSLGYLDYDRRRRIYRPSARVALLGNWVREATFRDGRLLETMANLNAATGAVLVLGAPAGLKVQYIHVLSGPAASSVRGVSRGASATLVNSAMGHLFMAQDDIRKVRQVVRRLNAEEAIAEHRVPVATLEEQLLAARRFGYAFRASECGSGQGLVAILLPRSGESEPLALGMSCPDSDAGRAGEIAAMLRNALSEGQTSRVELRRTADMAPLATADLPHERPAVTVRTPATHALGRRYVHAS